jgi:hypothetical protein
VCGASAAIVDLDEEMTRVVVPVRVQGVARWTAVLASSAGGSTRDKSCGIGGDAQDSALVRVQDAEAQGDNGGSLVRVWVSSARMLLVNYFMLLLGWRALWDLSS